ncbi:MAG TPA: hypothetical protein VIC71_04155 [Gammaproteobacteria bacterium]|jgi:hypothetical protein
MLALRACGLERDGLAVEQNLFRAGDTLTEYRGFPSDDDAPFRDPTLDLAPRTEP